MQKVNSESVFEGILMKKDRIDFTSDIVEKEYHYLSFGARYSIDEKENLWEFDPVGVVRKAIELSQYELDSMLYGWGTK